MADNSTTKNLNLQLTLEEDVHLTFKEWRLLMNGENDSNMTRIDTAFGSFQDVVAATKADGITYNPTTGLLNLTANGDPLTDSTATVDLSNINEATKKAESISTTIQTKLDNGDFNGKPAYVHIAFANSEDGSTDFTIIPKSGIVYTYLGIYSDNTATQKTSSSAYTWSLISDEVARAAAESKRQSDTATAISNAQAATTAAKNAAASVSMLTFDIDTSDGYLYVNNPEILDGISFEVSDGYLEVVS